MDFEMVVESPVNSGESVVLEQARIGTKDGEFV